MNNFALSGDDTLVITDIVLEDVANNDWALIRFEGQIADARNAKNGNAVFASDVSGLQAILEVRVLRGSNDDKSLDSMLQQQLQDFASFELMDGSFIKRMGDGSGNVTNDAYVLSGGIFQHIPDAKSNAEADTEQSISVYRMKFAYVQRAMQ